PFRSRSRPREADLVGLLALRDEPTSNDEPHAILEAHRRPGSDRERRAGEDLRRLFDEDLPLPELIACDLGGAKGRRSEDDQQPQEERRRSHELAARATESCHCHSSFGTGRGPPEEMGVLSRDRRRIPEKDPTLARSPLETGRAA